MASENDLVGLRRNDSNLTYLQLLKPDGSADLSDSSLQEVISVLKFNTHVQRVRVLLRRHFFLSSDNHNNTGQQEDEESVRIRRGLFAAVGALPHLEQLKIDSYMGMVHLPIQVLSETMTRARHLKELELWDLKLVARTEESTNRTGPTSTTGEQNEEEDKSATNASDDLKYLQMALQDHPCLQRFTLYNCQCLTAPMHVSSQTTTATTTACSLDPLVRALATMPNLQKVYITAAAANSSESTSLAFSCQALEHLCSSTSLRELGLWKFNFPSSNTAASSVAASQQRQQSQEYSTATVLHDNNTPIMMEPLTFMAPAMAQSNTMTTFEFGKCHLSPEGDQAMAAMLRTNTSLLELDLHLDSSFSAPAPAPAGGDVFVATAKALEVHNQTLRSLKLWGLLSRENQEALVAMMKHNYTLETCRLLDADCDISQQIEFYIGLNRNGRKRLLTSTHMNAASFVVSSCFRQQAKQDGSSTLSTIYYYLSMRPGLCFPG